ncbi:MAG: hypothetical protein GEV11_14945 [Streptosporangiales bacterium]|nr:hypothetical protein [Streptosporangiales bacterium]
MKWVLQRVGAAVAAVVLLVVAAGVAVRAQYSGTPAAWARSTGHDALWMGHAWVDGSNKQPQLDALAARLRGGGIRDVYVHVGPFELNGRLNPAKYPDAEGFLRRFRVTLPGVRVQAWAGQRVDHGLDLDDRKTRARILDGVRDLREAGFDGVHYNFEPMRSGGEGFLTLLKATRPLLRGSAGAGASERGLLSTSIPQIEPLGGLRLPVRLVAGRDKYWSEGYVTDVADRVDQIALMTYDSVMPMESLYGGHVVRQASLALRAVPKDVDLLIGAPAYHEDTATHDPDAETMGATARGARLALSELSEERARERTFGLAIYVDFAARPGDWEAYHRHWVRGR